MAKRRRITRQLVLVYHNAGDVDEDDEQGKHDHAQDVAHPVGVTEVVLEDKADHQDRVDEADAEPDVYVIVLDLGDPGQGHGGIYPTGEAVAGQGWLWCPPLPLLTTARQRCLERQPAPRWLPRIQCHRSRASSAYSASVANTALAQ